MGHSRRASAAAPRAGEIRRGDAGRTQADRGPGAQDASDAAKPRVSRRHRPRFAPATVWWPPTTVRRWAVRSEEHTSELQSRLHLVCRLLLEKKKKQPRH